MPAAGSQATESARVRAQPRPTHTPRVADPFFRGAESADGWQELLRGANGRRPVSTASELVYKRMPKAPARFSEWCSSRREKEPENLP